MDYNFDKVRIEGKLYCSQRQFVIEFTEKVNRALRESTGLDTDFSECLFPYLDDLFETGIRYGKEV